MIALEEKLRLIYKTVAVYTAVMVVLASGGYGLWKEFHWRHVENVIHMTIQETLQNHPCENK